jgi:hypothetical protein
MKDEMIPKLKEDNYLYYKMKYWKTKETLNLLCFAVRNARIH